MRRTLTASESAPTHLNVVEQIPVEQKHLNDQIDQLATKYAMLTYLVNKLKVVVSVSAVIKEGLALRRSTVRQKDSLPTY